MDVVLLAVGGIVTVAALVLVSAARLSSRMSQTNIVVQEGPGKRVVIVDGALWREEYAREEREAGR